MNGMEDLYYAIQREGTLNGMLGSTGMRLDGNGLLKEGSYQGLLPGDVVQIRSLDPDPADLNGRNVELIGVSMNQQPAVVELLPEEEEHAKSQSKGLGSLVKLHAYRILTARCAEERRRMDSGQLDVLLANDKRCGRVEKVGKLRGPYEPWRVRLNEVEGGSSGDAQAVLIEAPPFLLTKWIDVGDFALKRGHNKREEGVPVRQHVPANDSSEFIVEVLEQTTDDAGRDILTVVRVDD
eukprot:g17281.t1